MPLHPFFHFNDQINSNIDEIVINCGSTESSFNFYQSDATPSLNFNHNFFIMKLINYCFRKNKPSSDYHTRDAYNWQIDWFIWWLVSLTVSLLSMKHKREDFTSIFICLAPIHIDIRSFQLSLSLCTPSCHICELHNYIQIKLTEFDTNLIPTWLQPIDLKSFYLRTW